MNKNILNADGDIVIEKLFVELKKNKGTVFLAIIVCLVLAFGFIYYKSTYPVYQYNSYIRYPNCLGSTDINSIVYKYNTLSKEKGIINPINLQKGTYIINVSLKGREIIKPKNNPEVKLIDLGDKLTKDVVEEINNVAVKKKKEDYKKNVIKYLNLNMDSLAKKAAIESSFTQFDAARALVYLKNEVELKKADVLFEEAKMLQNEKKIALDPKTEKMKLLSPILAVIAGFAFATFRIIFKNS